MKTKSILPALMALIIAVPAMAADPDVTDDSRSLEDIQIDAHKNPGCGCCEIWADHLRSYGFKLDMVPDENILQFKAEKQIPRALMSCHTVMIDGYFIEGHVPATDILQLLKDKPEHVTGLAVPGMPLGSPGMEHSHPQDFNTIALLSDGSAYVYEEHEAGEDFSKESEK